MIRTEFAQNLRSSLNLAQLQRVPSNLGHLDAREEGKAKTDVVLVLNVVLVSRVR